MSFVKLCGVLILTLAMLILLRECKVSNGVLLSAGAVLFFLSFAVGELSELLSWMEELSRFNGFGEYFKILSKALGIALIAGMLSEFCRDLGEGTLSRAAELCGKCAILSLSLPLFRDFLEMLTASISGVE